MKRTDIAGETLQRRIRGWAFVMASECVGSDLQGTGVGGANGGVSTPGKVTPEEEVQTRRQSSSPCCRV